MAEIKDKVLVPVESAMHLALREIAENVYADCGVKINYVNIEWRDAAIGKSEIMSVSVNTETQGS